MWSSVCRAPGLAAYAAQLQTRLDTLTPMYGEEALSLAAVMIQVRDDLQQQRRSWQRRQQS